VFGNGEVADINESAPFPRHVKYPSVTNICQSWRSWEQGSTLRFLLTNNQCSLFCKLINLLNPTRFGVFLRHLQGVLDLLQHIKITKALICSNITVFAKNSHFLVPADVSILAYIGIFK
jgi:hypothetical protein